MFTAHTGLRASLLLLCVIATSACKTNQVDAGQVVHVSRVFVLPIKRFGGSSVDPAATSTLVAAFRSAGFTAAELANPAAPPDANPAIYVSGVAGGDDYCLEGLVRAVRLQQTPPEVQFEWRQNAKDSALPAYSREECAIKFVAGLKGELAKRKV